MLSEDAFLRRIPRVWDLEHRLLFEILVNASDSIEYSYNKLKENLRKIKNLESTVIKNPKKAEISTYIWTIIHNSHAFIQITSTLDRQKPGNVENFIQKFRPIVSKMRNGMEHPVNQTKNRARRNTPSYPLYGVLSFTTKPCDDRTFSVICIPLGGFQYSSELGPNIYQEMTPETNDIGNIIFYSYDYCLDIGELYDSVNEIVNLIDNTVSIQMRKIIEIYARERNINADDIMRDTINGEVLVEVFYKQNPE